MARYEKYKDSGQFWLGEVPAHWNFLKMKYVFSERSQKGFPNEPLLSATQNHGVIPQSLYENRVVTATKGLESLKLVEVGDFVISLRSFQGGIEYAYYRGIISPAYTILTPKGIDASYFKHFGKSGIFIDLLKSTVTGIREGQNVDYGKLREYYLPIPPIEEQRSMALYLDSATSEIDKAIAQQQRMIDLLNERKQIIIQNAVIKGLDPDVPMKDSGVDWIGDIPAHWEWTANKYIFRPYKKIVGEKAKDYTLLSLSKQGVIKRDLDNPTGKFPTSFDTYQEVNPGDFIFCFFDNEETPRTVGLSTYRGMITGAYDVLKVINKEFDARYLLYYFLTIDEAKRFRPLWRGLRKTIPFDSFMKYKIAQPPLEEQKRIVTYLDLQMQEIDRGILNMEKTIETLQERKRIIINDVVTGKIKVS